MNDLRVEYPVQQKYLTLSYKNHLWNIFSETHEGSGNESVLKLT